MTSIYPTSTSSNTSSSTSSANLLRISGMASGIDTDSVVKSMVSNYQARIDKANQAKQTLQWKQEAYRDIIKDIKGLQDYFDPLSSKYILSSNSFNINSISNSNSAIFSAAPSSNAKTGTYTMDVQQLAEQAKITGSPTQNPIFKVTDGSEWSGAKLTIDGTTITLDSITNSNGDGTTLDEVVANINSKISADSNLKNIGVSASLNNGKIEFANSTASAIPLSANDSSGSSLISEGISITANSQYDYSEDISKWNGANLTFSLDPSDATKDVKLDPISVTDTNGNGTTLDEIVANINSQISAKPTLSGIVSASYVKEGNNTYIKFTSTSSMKLTATSSSGTAGDLVNNKTINSGITSSSKLSDLGIADALDFKLSYDSTTTTKPVEITASSTDTLQTLMDKVNSTTSGAVTMSIDDATGKISFQSKSYGSASNVNITNVSNIDKLLGASTTLSDTGIDAIVDITAPGQSKLTTTQSSNKFTTNGVTYNLVKVGSASSTVTSNSDTSVSNMKKFIDDYNSVISKINTKLTEKKDNSYAPLTDAQKESMSESQITAWESKAKVGILKNDDYLNSLMTQLRGVFNSPVYSNYNSGGTNTAKISLNFGSYGTGAVGIDTSTDYTDGGKLVLKDETKLKNAIENNLDDFKKLFIGDSDSTLNTNQTYIGSKKYYEDGIFKRMDNIIRDYVAAPGLGEDGTYTLAGSMNIFVNKQYDYSSSGSSGKNTLPDQVYSKTVSISKYQTQLKDAQTRYYNKFTALETAMNALNSQQSQLSSMLGTA